MELKRCGGPIWSEGGRSCQPASIPGGVLGCWGRWVRRKAQGYNSAGQTAVLSLKTQPRKLHSGLNYNFQLCQDVEICGCLDNCNPLQGSPSPAMWVCGPLWVSHLPRQLLFSSWLGRTSRVRKRQLLGGAGLQAPHGPRDSDTPMLGRDAVEVTEQNVHMTLQRRGWELVPGFLGLVPIYKIWKNSGLHYRHTEECSRHPLFDVRESVGRVTPPCLANVEGGLLASSVRSSGSTSLLSMLSLRAWSCFHGQLGTWCSGAGG